ncbi:MAG: 2,3-dihydroxyphenylpropionate 1,2-dioxygenase, partial [Betaproteobacteria bacterium]|nr:2,3-dihydroxyphenylpropionate 1,2-dioxygenase [Betaproteobacteria bacterium]
MAELVGVFAASHGPLLVREWDTLPQVQRARLQAAFAEMGRRVTLAKPDVIVEIAPDHWSNFFLDNIPTVCIGVGEMNDGPPEPWMKAFPHRELAGDADFAMHFAQTALQNSFEPSLSHRLKLDHGFCIPLWRMGLQTLPRIVPMVVNSIEPPLPSISRCFEWGRLLKKVIHSF